MEQHTHIYTLKNYVPDCHRPGGNLGARVIEVERLTQRVLQFRLTRSCKSASITFRKLLEDLMYAEEARKEESDVCALDEKTLGKE
ncbi:unnamed protein product [Allacma fusca]|uniref:Uncharacterized protein n=1 Tax=Allacma fusca TaxID=39272 RepID=A0A8J2L8X0_9HEXA|nr:unnamed protein product [Allacma fusca]